MSYLFHINASGSSKREGTGNCGCEVGENCVNAGEDFDKRDKCSDCEELTCFTCDNENNDGNCGNQDCKEWTCVTCDNE